MPLQNKFDTTNSDLNHHDIIIESKRKPYENRQPYKELLILEKTSEKSFQVRIQKKDKHKKVVLFVKTLRQN